LVGSGRVLGGLTLTESSHHLGDFTADDAAAGGVLELAGSLLKTESESFLFEIAEAELKFVGREFGDFFKFYLWHDVIPFGQ